jgi:THAP domain
MQKKSCIIPHCAEEKFELVHKFPSDSEKFNEWIRIITKDNEIPKLKDVEQETIRKKFFICCRHFELSHYKSESIYHY